MASQEFAWSFMKLQNGSIYFILVTSQKLLPLLFRKSFQSLGTLINCQESCLAPAQYFQSI